MRKSYVTCMLACESLTTHVHNTCKMKTGNAREYSMCKPLLTTLAHASGHRERAYIRIAFRLPQQSKTTAI